MNCYECEAFAMNHHGEISDYELEHLYCSHCYTSNLDEI